MSKTKSKLTKAIRLILVGMVFFSFSIPALADQYDDQIGQLQQRAAAARAQANTFTAQANDYQSKVNQLNAQIYAIQADINLNQAKYDRLTQQIADNTTRLATQKALLDENLRAIYQDGQVSTLEMLVSSDGIGEFLDRRQALQSVKDKISETVAGIKTLKAQLESDKTQTQSILADEQSQRQQIAGQQSQVSSLLALAEQNTAAANQQVQSANAQIGSLRAAQAASFARLHFTSNGSGNAGSLQFRNLSFGGACGGGYPGSLCNYETDSLVDQWQLYNRECVSYAAWAMASSGASVPGFNGHGNAYEWPGYLGARGYRVDNDPSGAAVVAIIPQSMIGGVGHAMVVENPNLGGGWIHVSQYNWWPSANGPYGLYSTMDVKTTGLEFIHFR